MSCDASTTNGLLLRIFDYEAGATSAINLDTEDVNSAIEAFTHPDSKDFLKDQIVVLVRGNLLFCCNLGNKAGTFAENLLELSERCEALSDEVKLQISDVPNAIEVERVRRVGVKKLDFSLSNYFESMDFRSRISSAYSAIEFIFGRKVSDQDIRRRSAMIGRLSLTRGKFRTDEVEKDSWLTEVGAEVMETGTADDYTIVLEDDSRISPARMRRSKQVKLSRLANTYQYESAVHELLQFAKECEKDQAGL